MLAQPQALHSVDHPSSDWLGKVLRVATIAVLAIAAGYRWFGEGRDFENYLEFFDDIGVRPSIGEQRYEVGFVTLAWIFKYGLFASYEVFAASLAAVSLSIKGFLISQYSKRSGTAFGVYSLLFYPIHEYTQIRGAISIAFVLLAIHLFRQNRQFSAATVFLASVTFHSSSLILASAFALYVLAKGRVLIALGLASAMVFALLVLRAAFPVELVATVNPLVGLYLENIQLAEQPTLFSVTNVLLAGALLLQITIGNTQIPDAGRPYFFLTIIGLLAFVVLRDVPVFAHRVKELLSVGVVLWAFDFRWSSVRMIPGALVAAAGVWSAWDYVVRGVWF